MDERLIYTAILLCVLTVVWIFNYGFVRGSLAGLTRFVWLGAFASLLFPDKVTNSVPSNVKLNNINVLIDDSNSMRKGTLSTVLDVAESKLKELEVSCKEKGCSLEFTRLSELSSKVTEDKSPIYDSLRSFLSLNSNEPWILISDGGDLNPTADIRDLPQNSNGLVLGLGVKDEPNVWLTNLEVPSFGFAEKPSELSVTVNRNFDDGNDHNIQIQAQVDGANAVSKNVKFRKGEMAKDVFLVLPSSAKGNHLVSVSSVAIKDEKLLWDNTVHAHLETVPNTIGVLHLSGSPAPDARYVRRFIKAEPKFDLISFFILRDTTDSQAVEEREMSLIPFPVERLFTQELPNFKLVVIQNFRMLQFLNSKYQRNLVDFVKNGGGLLFIGGPRAFGESDILSQNMQEILPFKTKGSGPTNVGRLNYLSFSENNDEESDTAPWYDRKLNYKIELSEIDEKKKELASIYEDLSELSGELSKAGSFSGLHHMEKVSFDDEGYTSILDAVSGINRFPLMSASYPGKGRAVWLYTNKLWELAANSNVSRDTYNQFLSKTFNWLIRNDIRKPISVVSVNVFADSESTYFTASFVGPAVRYYSHDKKWSLEVCGRKLEPNQYSYKKASDLEVEFSGVYTGKRLDGKVCEIKLNANHESFGSEKVNVLTYISKSFTDTELPYSETFLQKVAGHTGAKYVAIEESNYQVSRFLAANSAGDKVQLPPKKIAAENPYWLFESLWLILVALALPLEVILRRWDKIFGET